MEEAWMRDRALLRDLLQKTPQAIPEALAHELGRSVSWVKKWRKGLRERDPTDPRLLCSRSRAHHAPSFRWDPRMEVVLQKSRWYANLCRIQEQQRSSFHESAESVHMASL